MFRFFSGIFLAILFGLAFGQSAVTFGKGIFYFSYGEVSKILAARENPEPEMGAPSDRELLASEIAEYEDFPGNEPTSLNKGKISEDLSIPKTDKAIVANLETMKLDLYEDGIKMEIFEILGKGRPGTAWETPPGSFEILYKKENHFSTIGHVWMPYSMQFFGNYFIHGWPYYADGTPVAEGYSGGCIRLANEDMEKVYDFGGISTKVIVLGTTADTVAFSGKGTYTVKNNAVLPKITSKSYLVADIDSGAIIVSQNEKEQLPIASLTKLVTALVSLETLNQYQETVVSRKAQSTYGSQGNLSAGERILIGDLLYPLLLESSNDAAEVLAEFPGRKTFMDNLNTKARSIGMSDTSFEDPSGLSENNISTAENLFKLTRYIFKYKKYIFDLTRLKSYSNDEHTWYSNSRFKNDSYFIGGKNGFTDEARHTLITLVDLPLGEFEYRKVAVIILNSENTERDTRSIISYLLENVYYNE